MSPYVLEEDSACGSTYGVGMAVCCTFQTAGSLQRRCCHWGTVSVLFSSLLHMSYCISTMHSRDPTLQLVGGREGNFDFVKQTQRALYSHLWNEQPVHLIKKKRKFNNPILLVMYKASEYESKQNYWETFFAHLLHKTEPRSQTWEQGSHPQEINH